MIKKIFVVLFVILSLFVFTGCKNDNKQTDGAFSENKNVWKTDAKDFEDGWVLNTDVPDDEYGTYLGNGYFGMRLFSSGVCCKNNNPEESYLAGLYGNEVLLRTPDIAELHFYDVSNNQVTEFAVDSKNYHQSLDMKTATLLTDCTLKCGRKKVSLNLQTKVLRLADKSSKVYLQAKVSSDYKGQFIIVAPVKYSKNDYEWTDNSYKIKPKSTAERLFVSQKFISENIEKKQKRINLGAVCLGDYEQAQQALFDIDKNSDFTVHYIAELDRKPIETDWTLDDIKSYNAEHNKNWEEIWKSDIEIEGDPVSQQVMRSNMFYLLCSASEDYSVAPMGLSMNAFSGHIFWDAEMWMFPALIWQHPEFAKGMIKYRIDTLDGAFANADKNGHSGAEYAWESGGSGIETSPDSSTVKERHINGDIAFAIWQYYVITGDKKLLKEAYPVLRATADYWLSRSVKNADGKYEIRGVCPPDENADIVDNSIYTNAIAQINLWIANEASEILGEKTNEYYMQVANNIYIGTDNENNRFVIYDNYGGAKIKQADPELLLYPLKYNEFAKQLSSDYNFTEEIFKNTFDFYKNNVISNGPAMTSSAHAVTSARNRSEEAYSDFINSFKPFMRGYFNYFNEKRSSTYINWCFLTGAGSSYASVLWGFCGLDADYYNNYDKSDFKIRNNLPKEWKSVAVKGVKYKGKIYNILYKDGKAEIINK